MNSSLRTEKQGFGIRSQVGGLEVSMNWGEACAIYFLQLGEMELNCGFLGLD